MPRTIDISQLPDLMDGISTSITKATQKQVASYAEKQSRMVAHLISLYLLRPIEVQLEMYGLDAGDREFLGASGDIGKTIGGNIREHQVGSNRAVYQAIYGYEIVGPRKTKDTITFYVQSDDKVIGWAEYGVSKEELDMAVEDLQSRLGSWARRKGVTIESPALRAMAEKLLNNGQYPPLMPVSMAILQAVRHTSKEFIDDLMKDIGKRLEKEMASLQSRLQ